MNPKFKVGDKVSFIHKKKRLHGVVRIRDYRNQYWEKEQFTYDVECDIGWVKHIPEGDLELVDSSE